MNSGDQNYKTGEPRLEEPDVLRVKYAYGLEQQAPRERTFIGKVLRVLESISRSGSNGGYGPGPSGRKF